MLRAVARQGSKRASFFILSHDAAAMGPSGTQPRRRATPKSDVFAAPHRPHQLPARRPTFHATRGAAGRAERETPTAPITQIRHITGKLTSYWINGYLCNLVKPLKVASKPILFHPSHLGHPNSHRRHARSCAA